MFIDFFLELKAARVPVSLREYLTLIEAMDAGVAEYRVDDFYYLSRSCLEFRRRNTDPRLRERNGAVRGLPRGDGGAGCLRPRFRFARAVAANPSSRQGSRQSVARGGEQRPNIRHRAATGRISWTRANLDAPSTSPRLSVSRTSSSLYASSGQFRGHNIDIVRVRGTQKGYRPPFAETAARQHPPRDGSTFSDSHILIGGG